MNLSVVVPIYNEAENIEALIHEITATLEGERYEIIYVDDASSDPSLSILQKKQNDLPQLKIIQHQTRRGQSAALHSGVQAAQSTWVVSLDGDGQNDPQDIPRMLAARDQSEDPNLRLLIGWRTQRKDNWVRRQSSKIANSVRSFLLKDHTPDSGCGIKLFHRNAFLDLPFFDHMHRFLPALISRDGGTILSVPVNHRPRLHGKSKYGINNRLWVGITDLIGVAWLQRRATIHPDETPEAQKS